MTAKIKLNAASGGGSISINAPSSAGSDTDFLDTSGNLAVSGTTTCTGNLKVGTITDTSGNNSSTTAQISQGRAKVWCLYNGANNTVLDSFNTSSVTDNGTGDFTINFSTSFSNANYAVGSSTAGSSNADAIVVSGRSGGTASSDKTASSLRFQVRYAPSNSLQDSDRVSYICFGDM